MLAEITSLVITYKYWAIVPFALFEAPLMSIVIGFFAATGYLNLFLAFGIVIAGDFVGDTALYVFGRLGQPMFERIGFGLNLSPDRIKKVVAYFGRHDQRAIVVSKLVHGVGFTGLIVAGSVRVSYARFAVTCFTVTVLQSAALAAVGMVSGRAYGTFAHYLDYFDAVAGAVFVIFIFFLYQALTRRFTE